MKRRRGSALLELALSASALVALLAGGVQFGYTFHVYGQLQSALRNGAQYAASNGPCVDRIRNVVVYGDPQGKGRTPVVPGLSPEHIRVEFVKDSQGVTRDVVLSISGLMVDGLFSEYRFNGKPLVSAPLLNAPAGCE